MFDGQFVSKILVTVLVLGATYFALLKTWTSEIDLLALLKKPADAIPTKARVTEQALVVSPDVLDLGGGDWKATSQFSIYNPTDVFFYSLWVKLTINSESLSYEDFEVLPPKSLTPSWLQLENTRINTALIRFDGVDPSGNNCVYLVLETFAPGMTHTFEVSNISTSDLPSSNHHVDVSVIGYSNKPKDKMQDGAAGLMLVAPPEEIRVRRSFSLTEEGRLQLGKIQNEPGVIPNWSNRQKIPAGDAPKAAPEE